MKTKGRCEDVGTKVVREWCERMPDVASRTVARGLREAEPKLFRSVEAARVKVRMVRGLMGEKNRRGMRNKKLVKKPGWLASAVPAARTEREGEVRIPGKRVLILSDLHFPYMWR